MPRRLLRRVRTSILTSHRVTVILFPRDAQVMLDGYPVQWVAQRRGGAYNGARATEAAIAAIESGAIDERHLEWSSWREQHVPWPDPEEWDERGRPVYRSEPDLPEDLLLQLTERDTMVDIIWRREE